MTLFPHTVLCVDDEISILNALKRLFRNMRFTIPVFPDDDIQVFSKKKAASEKTVKFLKIKELSIDHSS